MLRQALWTQRGAVVSGQQQPLRLDRKWALPSRREDDGVLMTPPEAQSAKTQLSTPGFQSPED